MSTEKMTSASVDAIIDRMIFAAKAKNQQDMIEKIGLSSGIASKWRTRKKVPESSILKVAKVMGVSSEWLATGEGEMLQYAGVPAVTQIHRRVSDEEWQLIEYFECLGEEQRQSLLIVAKTMAMGLPGKSPKKD